MKQVGNALSHCAGQSLLFKNMCSRDFVNLLHRVPPDTSTPQKPNEAGWKRSVALRGPVFVVQEIFVPWMLLIFYIEFPQTRPRPRNPMKQFENVLSHCAGQPLLFRSMFMDCVNVLHRVPPDTSTPQRPNDAGWKRFVALRGPVFVVQ